MTTPNIGQANERGERWIEYPAEAGMRFVGYADELSSFIRHTGRYTDDDGMSETMRGAVWRLPTRKGKLRFVIGYVDPYNGEPAAFIDCSTVWKLSPSQDGYYQNRWSLTACQRDIVADSGAPMAADTFAERHAERERDYNRASSAGFAYAQLGDQLADARSEIVECLRSLKRVTDTKARQALCKEINDLRYARGRWLAERVSLRNGDCENLWFSTYDPNLRDVFADAAGIQAA